MNYNALMNTNVQQYFKKKDFIHEVISNFLNT